MSTPGAQVDQLIAAAAAAVKDLTPAVAAERAEAAAKVTQLQAKVTQLQAELDAATPKPPTGAAPAGPARTAGSLLPGGASYNIPTSGQVLYVSTSGSDTAAGTVSAPFRTVGRALQSQSNGGAVVLRGATSAAESAAGVGVYHEGGNLGGNGLTVTASNFTIQAYPGEEVWFEGASVMAGWTADTTSVPGRTVWSHSYTWVSDRSPTFSRGADDSTTPGWGFVNPAYPCAPWPDQVFVNGVRLTQVDALSKVTAGTFFAVGAISGVAGAGKYRFTPTKIFIGTNPTGATVKVTDLATCMILSTGAAGSGVTGQTLRGVGVRYYGPSVCDFGAVKAWGAGARLEHVYVTEIAAIGISAGLRPGIVLQNCTTNWCGNMGVHANNADKLVVDGHRSHYNNHQRFNFSPASGGLKITRALGARVSNSVISDNYTIGLWFDESVYDMWVYSNDIQNNTHHGIIAEICAKLECFDNLVTNNGGVSIFVRLCNDSRVWNNTVSDGGSAQIEFCQDARRPGTSAGRDSRQPYPASESYMTWVITNGQCFNNISVKPKSAGLAFRIRDQQGTPQNYTAFGITCDSNFYNRVSASAPANAWALSSPSNGNGVPYPTFAAYKTGSGNTFDQQGRSLDGSDGVAVGDGGYALTAAGAAAVSGMTLRPLPADMAARLGTPALHLGAWR